MFFDHDPYPPLISPRSPSYERAWHDFSEPSADRSAPTIALLAHLSEAERDASQLCARLEPLLGADPFADVIHDDATLHDARRQALGKLIEKLGGSAPAAAEGRVILTQTYAAAEHAHTSDDAKHMLRLMRKELGAQYDVALHQAQLTATQRAALASLAPAQSPGFP